MPDQSFMPDEPERHGSGKSKKKKPIEVWWRGHNSRWWRGWSRFGRYADLETAERVVKDQMRKQEHYSKQLWEYHIGDKPE